MSSLEQGELIDDELPPLLQAAKNADVSSFKKLLEDDEDVLQKDQDDRTVLHWAAQSGCIPVIMAGLSKGLMWHVNAKSKRGLTPLHEACLAGYPRTVHILLSIGADMTSQTKEGYTPLLCAAGNGHNDVTKLLIGAGCDGNALQPTIGVNALHIAAWTDQPHVIDDLLMMGCDINRKSKIGKTALEFAIEQNHTDCIDVLRNYKHEMQQELEQRLHEQENAFRTKLNRLADKIHKYYDDRLKQEINYFEQQLQEQHDKDAEIISKLKKQIDQLLKTELDDDEDEDEDEVGDESENKDKLGELKDNYAFHSMQSQDNAKLRLQRRRRSSQFARRPRMFSISAPSGHEHDSSEEEHDIKTTPSYARQLSAESQVQRRRPGSGKDRPKSMTELVDDATKRKTSVNYVKRQNSYTDVGESNQNTSRPLVPTIRLLQPGQPTRSRSTSPAMSTSYSSATMSPSPPPPSPAGSDAHPTSPSPSTSSSVFVEENNNPNTPTSPQPKTRRSSIAAFLRPHFNRSNTNDDEKSRRRSVVTKMPNPTPPEPKSPKPRKKGFSLFSVPLPGIPQSMINEEQHAPEVFDMEPSNSH